MRKNGFTLIELMTVIAIAAIATAFLVNTMKGCRNEVQIKPILQKLQNGQPVSAEELERLDQFFIAGCLKPAEVFGYATNKEYPCRATVYFLDSEKVVRAWLAFEKKDPDFVIDDDANKVLHIKSGRLLSGATTNDTDPNYWREIRDVPPLKYLAIRWKEIKQ